MEIDERARPYFAVLDMVWKCLWNLVLMGSFVALVIRFLTNPTWPTATLTAVLGSVNIAVKHYFASVPAAKKASQKKPKSKKTE